MQSPDAAVARPAHQTAPADPAAPPFLSRFKGWIMGLTGVFVVLPALINGAGDIYAALQKLPRTEAERINEQLTKKYFRKPPIAAIPVPIKQNNGTVEVRFEIYEQGDVFVEFGSNTQWFPFPSPAAGTRKSASFSLLSEAIAQNVPQAKGLGRYQQNDRWKEDAVLRERTFENGVVETQVIDIRSGSILSSTARQTPQKPVLESASAPAVQKIAPIDLDQLRTAQAKGETADWHASLKAGLAWCKGKDNFISRGLCESREKALFCEPQNRWRTVPECVK